MLVYKNVARECSLGAGRFKVVTEKGNVYNIMMFEMGSTTIPFGPLVIIYQSDWWDQHTVNDSKTNHQLKHLYHINGDYYVASIVSELTSGNKFLYLK